MRGAGLTDWPRRAAGCLRRRWRLLLLLSIGLLLAATAVFESIRPSLEARVRETILAKARQRGLVADVAEVRVGLFPPLTLRGLTVTRPGRFRLAVSQAELGLAPWGHSLAGLAWRVRLDSVTVSLPAGVELDLAPSAWDVRPARSGRRLLLRRAGEQLEVGWTHDGGIRIAAVDLQLSGFIEVRRGGTVLSDLGVVSVEAHVTPLTDGRWRIEVQAGGREMRFATITQATESAGAAPGTSPASADSLATDASLAFVALLDPLRGDVEISECRISGGGARAAVKGALRHAPDDPSVDLHLSVERVDFARLLATAGLELPTGAVQLGSAALQLDVRGRAREPSSFVVKQRVDFTPPGAPIPAVERLKGPFVAEIRGPAGRMHRLVVGPDSPDFIALADVPPLFQRALLLSEDSNFYGHRGLDFAEMPVAMATNWLRGTNSRGASTITQQLAKNLFLTREKSVSRKLSEAALALLIDATLGKQRELEIYLNVIEWGPDIYGLRAAARHYFARDPGGLTTKEIAFLIALIPGPIRYQHSFASGVPSPAFENLMDGVLAKLRSVDAIDEEQYEAALAETLLIRPSEVALPPNGGEEEVTPEQQP
jgi:hypothetical protein